MEKFDFFGFVDDAMSKGASFDEATQQALEAKARAMEAAASSQAPEPSHEPSVAEAPHAAPPEHITPDRASKPRPTSVPSQHKQPATALPEASPVPMVVTSSRPKAKAKPETTAKAKVTVTEDDLINHFRNYTPGDDFAMMVRVSRATKARLIKTLPRDTSLQTFYDFAVDFLLTHFPGQMSVFSKY